MCIRDSYIFMKGGPEESENYSVNFLRILNRLNEIGKNDISFNRYINFEREIFFNDDFTRKIGSRILEIINKDFRWNLFFRIIFEIEEGNNAEDFEGFMIFIRYRFYENLMLKLENKDMEEYEKDEIINYVMEDIATAFSKEIDIDFLSDCSIKSLNYNIGNLFDKIDSFMDWKENKEKISEAILNHDF